MRQIIPERDDPDQFIARGPPLAGSFGGGICPEPDGTSVGSLVAIELFKFVRQSQRYFLRQPVPKTGEFCAPTRRAERIASSNARTRYSPSFVQASK